MIFTDERRRRGAVLVTPAIQMTAAASGSNGITVADDDDIDFGTGDFFLHWEGSLPDWTPSGNVYLVIKEQSGAAELYMRVTAATGVITTALITSGVTRFSGSSLSAGIADGSMAKITAVVARETAGAAGSIAYYINGAPLGSPVSIAAGAPVSASNSGNLIICGLIAGARYASNTISCIVGNFAPTASEVLDLCTNGIPASWKWGSQTAFSTSDFSAGADGYSNQPGSTNVFTGNVDGISGVDNVLQIEGSGTIFNLFKTNIVANHIGKKILFTFDYFAESGCGVAFLGFGGNTQRSNVGNNIAVVEGSWQSVTMFVQPVSTYDTVQSRSICGYTTIAGATGDPLASGKRIWLKNLVYKGQGATMALLPDTIPTSSATTWSDTSGNTGGGTLPAAGATKVTIRK